jgi:hypothetical protein
MNPARSGTRTKARAARDTGAIDSMLPLDGTDTAKYIAQMSAELAEMASSARLDMLAYFLDMARLEAEAHHPASK